VGQRESKERGFNNSEARFQGKTLEARFERTVKE
jgi:hypothetical protein